jgi:hypothetical protein
MRMLKKKNAWTGGARDCHRGEGVQLAQQRQRMHVNIAKHLQLETRHTSRGRVRLSLRVQTGRAGNGILHFQTARSECRMQRPECRDQGRAVDLETAAQRFRKHEGKSTAEG